MAENSKSEAVKEVVVWAADFRRAFKIGERTFRNWRLAKIVPDPDGNILGRDFWLAATYRKVSDEILSGKYSRVRRPQHLLRATESAA